jgi:hypothetical protein
MHGTLEGGDAEDGGDEQSVNEGNAFPQWYVVPFFFLSCLHIVIIIKNSLLTPLASFASLSKLLQLARHTKKSITRGTGPTMPCPSNVT